MTRLAADLRDARIYVSVRETLSPYPEKYRWRAVWWRLFSRESSDPAACRRVARYMLQKYREGWLK